MKHRSMKYRYSLMALCMLLPACSILGGKPQPNLHNYALEVAQVTAPAAPEPTRATASANKKVLLVNTVNAAAGYDSKQMVYQREPQLLEAYTQSAWIDTPAHMLEPLLVQTLQSGGGFRAVLLAPSAAKAELRLDTEIVQLQQNFLAVPSSVRFSLQATLSDNRTRAVLASQLFEVVQPSASEDAAGGSAAANLAVQQLLQQVSRFVASGAQGAKN